MKKQLTPKIAETLAIQKFQQIESEEDREFRIAHAKTVGETAIILAEGKNLDNNILLIAGWIHDIGSIISQDNHAVHSLDMLIKEDYEISAKLKDCILNHGTGKSPQTEEGKIIQLADKVSIFNPEIIKILKKYSLKKNKELKEKDLDFIRKMVNQALNLLKE